MKKLYFSFLAFFLLFTAFAAEVPENQAILVAKTQFKLLHNLPSRNAINVELAYSKTFEKQDKSTSTAFYVFNMAGDKGFVIVAGDDKIIPILAYSNEGSFIGTDLPAGVDKLMFLYRNGIAQIANDVAIQATPEISAKWNALLNDNVAPSATRAGGVGPLTTTTWSQRPYYNKECPGTNAPTGCVQTAITQVMKFWNHPAQGTGNHSYNHNEYGTLSANFGSTTYDWANMPNSLNGSSTPQQVDAIAKLMFHVGVAMQASYSEDGTGAYTERCQQILPRHFGYKSGITSHSRSSNSIQSWKNLMQTELDAGRILIHNGFCPSPSAGHAFVVDGYDTTGKFSYNWGWGGSYNGFFEVDNLNPGSTYTWNQGQRIFIKIQPEVTNYDLKLINSISLNPTQIDFNSPFTVTAEVGNFGNATYTGKFRISFYDSLDNNVGNIDTVINDTLLANDLTTLNFSTTGLSITPGTYALGLYADAGNGQWVLVNEDTYTNPIDITIQSTNTLGLISNGFIIVNPDPIKQNDTIDIDINVINTDNTAFTGTISVDLHDLNGDWIQEIASLNATILAGATESLSFTNTTGLSLDPGTYKVVIWHKFTGSDWEIIQEGTYPNSKDIDIVVLDFAESLKDQYEDNDSLSVAYQLPVTFVNDVAVVTTSDATTHTGSDFDYYKVHLDPNYDYLVYARVYDSYNDGGRGPFTNDMMFNYYFRTDAGDYYDDEEMPSIIAENIDVNGEDFIFEVLSFYPDAIVEDGASNSAGTYQIEIEIIRQGQSTSIADVNANPVKVYPNPTNSVLNIAHSGYDQLTLLSVNGQVLQTKTTTSTFTNLDMTSYAAGVYFIQLRNEKDVITKRIEVVR